MKIPRFSADGPIDLSPIQSEKLPAGNAELNEKVQSMEGYEISETARINVILRATIDFYFAKYFFLSTANVDYEGDDRLKLAVEHLRASQLRQAVISIATTIDLTSNGGVGRTASLPHMIDNILNLVVGDSADTFAVHELANEIKTSVNVDRHKELQYVRHMRNKWAGHASLDLKFDSWADGDSVLELGYLEAALVRVINAYEDFSDLERMSDDLIAAMQRPAREPKVGADGREYYEMGVNWASVGVFSSAMRESTSKQVDRLVGVLIAGSDKA